MATFFHRKKSGISQIFGIIRAAGGRTGAKREENGRWIVGKMGESGVERGKVLLRICSNGPFSFGMCPTGEALTEGAYFQ